MSSVYLCCIIPIQLLNLMLDVVGWWAKGFRSWKIRRLCHLVDNLLIAHNLEELKVRTYGVHSNM